MSINTISAGQRDWVDILDNNFTELSKKFDKAPVVLGAGFNPAGQGGNDNQVWALPLPNGLTLKIMHLSIQHDGVQPAKYSPIVTVPDEFGTQLAQPVGTTYPLNTNGHNQGYLEFWWANYNNLGGTYWPFDGQAGPFSFSINTTILYI